MLQSGRVNHQGHREEGPERTALQHKRGQRRLSGQEATGEDPMPGSSGDHLRQPTVETDVIEQSIAMDAGTARVSEDRANQGVLRMDQEEGISAEEQAGRRLRSKQPARRSLTDDEAVTKKRRLRRSNKIFSKQKPKGQRWNRHTSSMQTSRQ